MEFNQKARGIKRNHYEALGSFGIEFRKRKEEIEQRKKKLNSSEDEYPYPPLSPSRANGASGNGDDGGYGG